MVAIRRPLPQQILRRDEGAYPEDKAEEHSGRTLA
jgi:hypothetical protein